MNLIEALKYLNECESNMVKCEGDTFMNSCGYFSFAMGGEPSIDELLQMLNSKFEVVK